ncbi:MAG: zf-TFIIB domain-containing protein [Lentisphaeraceae bacterium]|nr:zf-TFIIB domain-containing protein [Lentisphaeraceae bacterium]
MSWFSKKTECVHCKDKMTKKEFEGKATCLECRMNILCNRETRRNCPVDGALLVKAYNDKEIIIDRCPKCNGIWLDADELEAIKAIERTSSGSGMATGIILGNMMS